MTSPALADPISAPASGAGSIVPGPVGQPQQAVSVVDRLREIGRTRTPFSVEFYPPRNADEEAALWRSTRVFERFGTAFVNVTYGAGGKTREKTFALTGQLAKETTLLVIGHLTLVDHSVDELRSAVAAYADQGVQNILAIRGDPSEGPEAEWVKHPQGFEYAEELVRLTRSLGDFHVGVASFPSGHHRSPDLEHDTRHLVSKLRAGAEYSISQMFFDVEDFLRLRDRVAAYDPVEARKPLIPGIMPITSLKTLRRVVYLSGEKIPPALEERLAKAAGDGAQEDRMAVRAIGIDLATQMCQRLVDEGADCLHFNTLNFSKATIEVLGNLGYTFKQ